MNKGNNKITEHQAIFQRERQNSYINKQRQNQSTTGKLGKPQLALTWYMHSMNMTYYSTLDMDTDYSNKIALLSQYYISRSLSLLSSNNPVFYI